MVRSWNWLLQLEMALVLRHDIQFGQPHGCQSLFLFYLKRHTACIATLLALCGYNGIKVRDNAARAPD